jgi:hypothetical protein
VPVISNEARKAQITAIKFVSTCPNKATACPRERAGINGVTKKLINFLIMRNDFLKLRIKFQSFYFGFFPIFRGFITSK